MKRYSRSSAEGLTIIELTIAMSLTLVIVGGAFVLAVSSRRIYQADAARTQVNQSMRAIMGILVADIRQAGERLGDDFPALEIVDGSGGAPDQLIVRRNLVETVLRACSDTAGTVEHIEIADTTSPPQGCGVVPDDDADGWPENLEVWRDFRLANGSGVRAYIYNSSQQHGEFFDYIDEDAGSYRISAPSGTTWTHSYPVLDVCRLYLLEERRYELGNDMLQVILNGADGAPLRLVEGMTDFQAVAVFQDFSEQQSLDASDVWSDLRSIQIDVSGSRSDGDRVIERTWSNEVMPRNILSR